MGEEYNCWFPIYIDQKHYQTNKQTILNALTCLVHGASALKQYDFQPSYIARIFPKLLISMLYTLAGSPNQISEAFRARICIPRIYWCQDRTFSSWHQ